MRQYPPIFCCCAQVIPTGFATLTHATWMAKQIWNAVRYLYTHSYSNYRWLWEATRGYLLTTSGLRERYVDSISNGILVHLLQVVRGFTEMQNIFVPSKFMSCVEADAPTTKLYRFHGALIHPTGERVPISTECLLLRESRLKVWYYKHNIMEL